MCVCVRETAREKELTMKNQVKYDSEEKSSFKNICSYDRLVYMHFCMILLGTALAIPESHVIKQPSLLRKTLVFHSYEAG